MQGRAGLGSGAPSSKRNRLLQTCTTFIYLSQPVCVIAYYGEVCIHVHKI